MINDIFKRVKLLCWGMLLALIVGCTSEEVEGIYPDDWKYYDLVSGSAFIHCRLLIYSYLCTIILKSNKL